MVANPTILLAIAGLSVVAAQCPFGHSGSSVQTPQHARRSGDSNAEELPHFIDKHIISDLTDDYLTSDVGGPIEDQGSLKASERGPTLLEDFVFRQKITHFDHERVPERAVHARGAGAHGVFESYGDWSNITAASFLSAPGKKTPTFVRFSTVAGSRGSADTVRDVHGFATRFYTDEGNFDIVGNNIPVFFIQDAILFPDLIHAVKPRPDSEIPQAASAHDSAWDFFSQQPSTLHTLFWAMSGHGIPRSYRHMDGFGVHTFRFVTDEGKSRFVKFHWKTLQGKASLVWEEAQAAAGKNADFHRQDLFDSISNGYYPQWEFGVQIVEEDQAAKFDFDILDPTKIIPEELVPVTELGKMTLNRNPTNYFAETEQVMFQPGHIVRGVDFSEDPLLQGRIFSYLDTQLNRHGGPNFEQLPINAPISAVHNNNRDGAGQMFVHANQYPYSPNTFTPLKQANRTHGRGFFTSPSRKVSGAITRVRSQSFDDVYTQPRLFFNSLHPTEQQFLVNAISFETSQLQSEVVKQNVLIRLNQVDHGIARKVAEVLNLQVPEPDSEYYHDNTTMGVSVVERLLPSLDGFKVAYLTTVENAGAASNTKASLAEENVELVVIAERLGADIDKTYSTGDATAFDGIIVGEGASSLFGMNVSAITGALFPAGRPTQIVLDGFRYGKPIGFADETILQSAPGLSSHVSGPGVYVQGQEYSRGGEGVSTVADLAAAMKNGLRQFKFLERFAAYEPSL